MNTRDVDTPSGRKVVLKMPGPFAVARHNRDVQDDDVESFARLIVSAAVEPKFSSVDELDDWLAENYADLPALTAALTAMLQEAQEKLAPLSATAEG